MNNMKTENIEALLLQYAENELDDTARAEVEALLAAHPEYLRMLEEYDPAFRLPAPPAPEFPDKGTLLKTIPMPRWIVRSLSAAAVILLLCLAIPTTLRQLHQTGGNEFTAQNGGERQTQPAANPEPDTTAAMQPANILPARKATAATVMEPVTAIPATGLMAEAAQQPAILETQPEAAVHTANTEGTTEEIATTTHADSVTIVYVYTDNLVEYVTILHEDGTKLEQQTPPNQRKLLQWMEKIIRNNMPEELEEELSEKITAGTETVKRFYGKVTPMYNTLLSYLSNK